MGMILTTTLERACHFSIGVSLFEYFKRVATTNIPVEAKILASIMQLDYHITPHKRRRIYPSMLPDK